MTLPKSLTNEGELPRISVRASYLRFPRWTQPLWTRLTGKPLPNEQAWFTPHPALSLSMDVLLAIGTCAVHLYLLTSSRDWLRILGYVVAPMAMVFLVRLLRKIQVVYGHHAIHETLFRRGSRMNGLVSKGLTIFVLAQNEIEYEQEHLDHHRRSVFTTRDDADASLLFNFGIRPGRSVAELNHNLLSTLFSPVFHLWFLKSRVMSNLRRPLIEQCLVVVWLVVLIVVMPACLGVNATAIALWLPLTALYQMSALLQFSTEHVWLVGAAPGVQQGVYAERCHGRFCGECVPGADGNVPSPRVWLRWWCRTLFMHIPMRVGVLVGDLPAHDWHHLASAVGHSHRSWPDAIFERQRAIDSGNSAGMEERELWGIENMIAHVFVHMSQASELPAESELAAGTSPANGS